MAKKTTKKERTLEVSAQRMREIMQQLHMKALRELHATPIMPVGEA